MRQAAYYKRPSFPRGTPLSALAAALLSTLLAGGLPPAAAAQPPAGEDPDIRLFFEAANPDDDAAEEALEQIAAAWRDGYAPIVRDMLRLLRPPAPPAPTLGTLDPTRTEPAFELTLRREHPSTRVWRRLRRFVEQQTGERFGGEVDRLQHWIWEQPYDPHPD